jgi:ATP-dependent Clp protease ATP-binding subunit ClpC
MTYWIKWESREQMEAMEAELSDMLAENQDDIDGVKNDLNSALSGFVPGGAATFPFIQNIYPGGFNNQEQVQNGSSSKKSPKEKHKTKRKHIDAYCTNLTAKARAQQIDAVIGREKEIARVIQILSRRTKNNPCLIGEPGVGKTAVAEVWRCVLRKEKFLPYCARKKYTCLI